FVRDPVPRPDGPRSAFEGRAPVAAEPGDTNGSAAPAPRGDAADPRAGRERGEILNRITAVGGEVTRYPLELLTADAQFEDELGIDSVKFGEIIAAVREAFPTLPAPAPTERPARTLRELAERVQARLQVPGPAPVAAVAAARPATRGEPRGASRS